MKPMKRTAALVMAAAMLLTLLCACGGGGEETPEEEQFALRVCVQNEPDTLDPAMVGAAGKSVMHHLFENLMRMSDDGDGVAKIDNGIASGYTVTENEDGTETYLFNLRETARWSDGTKLTASDFVFAWRRLANPKTDSPNHTLLSGIVGYDEVRGGADTSSLAVSAENKYTFSVTLKSHDPYFLENVCTAAWAARPPVRRQNRYPGIPYHKDSARLSAQPACDHIRCCRSEQNRYQSPQYAALWTAHTGKAQIPHAT